MSSRLTIPGIAGILFGLLAFPLFYFVYKFGNPMFGTNDFFSYYKLYKDWDFTGVEAPFNMRLFSSFIVYLLNKSGLHYNTETAFDQFGLDKQVYFNAVFFNFLCVIMTCVIIFITARRHFGGLLLSFVAGVVYLLGFGTIFFELMPITDALSVCLFAWILYYYLEKSKLIIFPLLLLILQREYIFLALGLLAFMDFIKWRQKYYGFVLLYCVAGFATYYVLRKTIFYTEMFDFQASPDFFLDSILKIKFPVIPFVRQTLMTMNLFFVYLLILLYKKRKGLQVDGYGLIRLLVLLAQICIISIAAVFGNNAGRYYYILVPLVIFQAIKEFKPVLDLNEKG